MGGGEKAINELCCPGGCRGTQAKKASRLLADSFGITRGGPMHNTNDFKADRWSTPLVKGTYLQNSEKHALHHKLQAT